MSSVRKIRRQTVPRETVVYCGVEFYRYPESPRKHKRNYFWASRWTGKRRSESLHRAIWETEKGPIPDGYEVHHKDDNSLNNDLSNLVCISKKDHRRDHADKGAWNTDRHLAHLARARRGAARWHKSSKGRKWHREHMARMWNSGKFKRAKVRI